MEPWKTSIEFTVTPTDDPDVVEVTSAEITITWAREDAYNSDGPYPEAARAYFDAHPPKPEYQDGDRVQATGDGAWGNVTAISDSGTQAFVRWDDNEFPGWYDIEYELTLA